MSERTPRTWDEGAWPTAQQLADWLAACTLAERITHATIAIQNGQMADRCFTRNHDDLAARLADAEARAEAAEAKVARVEALADKADANRASHFDVDDCGCSMKDCYECGYWCRCTHTPWAGIREALRGDQ